MDTTSDRGTGSSAAGGFPTPPGGGARPSADDDFGWPTELVDPSELAEHLARRSAEQRDVAAARRRRLAARSKLPFDQAFDGVDGASRPSYDRSTLLRESFGATSGPAAPTSPTAVLDRAPAAPTGTGEPGAEGPPSGDGIERRYLYQHERTRHATTKGEWVGLAVLSLLGASLVARTGASPTGVGVIDAVYSFAYVGALVLAASMARRWALVVASMAVAVVGSGLALLIAVVALGVTGYLVLRDDRSRIVGGSVGALVAVAIVHLEPGGGALGALVPLGACAVLVVSGLANVPEEHRRRVRTTVLVLVGAAAALVLVAAGLLASAQGEVTSGVRQTEAAVAAVEQGDESAAADRLVAARDDFDAAHDRMSSPLFSPVLAVPILSQNYRAVRDATDVGAEVTGTMAAEVASLDYEELDRPTGGIDTAVLASFEEPVARVDGQLRSSLDGLGEIDDTWLLGPVEGRLGDLEERLTTYQHETEVAVLAAAHGPEVLGSAGTRRYLVLLGNPAEARDLGGHIGTWAEVTFTAGVLDLVEVGGPRDLALTGDTGATADVEGYPPSLADLDPRRFPQNWGADPDLPTVARLSAELFEEKTGRALDGVAYADPEAFAAIVGITGAKVVPGTDPPVKLTADNAADFLTRGQYEAFATEQEANDAVESLVRDVFEELETIQLPAPRRLSASFAPLVDQGRFAFVSLREEDRPLLDAMAIERRMADPTGAVLLGVVNRNANPSKIDAYLRRSTDADVRLDPDTGEVTGSVTVTLTNEAPPSGLSDVVLGNQYGLPSGTNVTDLALLTRFELDGVEVDGEEVDAQPTVVGDYWRHTVRVEVPAGETIEVRYAIRGTVSPGSEQRLELVGQPLAEAGELHVTVTSTDGGKVRGRGAGVLVLPAGEGGVEVEVGDDVHRTIGLTVG